MNFKSTQWTSGEIGALWFALHNKVPTEGQIRMVQNILSTTLTPFVNIEYVQDTITKIRNITKGGSK